MNLFPMIDPQAAENEGAAGLYIETAWDFENNVPIYRNGAPILVTGLEAVTVWAWLALNTQRFAHEVYTWSYGNEVARMIGKPFTDELKQSEAPRLVRECLMINPYITGVKDITVTFGNDALTITCVIITVYGEVRLDV